MFSLLSSLKGMLGITSFRQCVAETILLRVILPPWTSYLYIWCSSVGYTGKGFAKSTFPNSFWLLFGILSLFLYLYAHTNNLTAAIFHGQLQLLCSNDLHFQYLFCARLSKL